MASITIRKLDEAVKQRLREQAAGHGRSLEAEVRHILNRSANLPPQSPQPRTGLDLFRGIREAVEEYGGAELDIPPRTPMRELGFEEEQTSFRRTSDRQRRIRRRKK